jgi:hypothetical protein
VLPSLRWLVREPLVHFFVIGGLFFVVLGRGEPEAPEAQAEIVVTKADIDRLSAGFAATWRRPPTKDELQGTVNDFIREEVLYRSGLSLGLERDDTIIRRRLRQKMEFLFEDTIAAPSEPELRAFHQANADRFREEPRLAFRQIFLSERRPDPGADARALLVRLAAPDAGAEQAGDPMLLPGDFGPAPISAVRAQYGDAFARQIAPIAPGSWSGPLKSAYGLHLVLVTAQEPARLQPFEQVRDAVQREWYAARRAAVLDEQYRKLRSGFDIRIEDEPGSKKAAEP